MGERIERVEKAEHESYDGEIDSGREKNKIMEEKAESQRCKRRD